MVLLFGMLDILDMLICCFCICTGIIYIPYSFARCIRYMYHKIKRRISNESN